MSTSHFPECSVQLIFFKFPKGNWVAANTHKTIPTYTVKHIRSSHTKTKMNENQRGGGETHGAWGENQLTI